jgi:riboflavin kinase/FMN adenylyltransferase
MVAIIKSFLDGAVFDFSGQSLVMAIGTFDGVHLGHRKLIGVAIDKAKEIGGVAVVYTFRPHPTSVTQSGEPKPMLCNFDEKYNIFGNYDLIAVVEQKFDEEFSQVSSYDFIEFLRRKFPTLKLACIGEDFRFGHDRLGDTVTFAKCAKLFGIDTVIVPSLIFNGKRVSSSRIRRLLGGENIHLANLMLGKEK